MKTATTRYCYWESPLGRLMLAADERGLTALDFEDGKYRTTPTADWQQDTGAFASLIQQLEAYFGGALKEFEIALAPPGTPFQQEVWQALHSVPYGETLSYGALAQRIGRPNAQRAVGAANGRNPIAIIIPCHRIIGHSGKLTGYGGGMDRKKWLLALERRHGRQLNGQTTLL